jgi:hypothetical protein
LKVKTCQASCRCDSTLPLYGSFGSEFPQCGSGDEVALKVEGIVNADLTNERRGHLAPFLGFPTSAAVFILSVKFFDAFLLGNDEKAQNTREKCKTERHFDFSRKITD